ncbi:MULTISPECIES: hypothetical protein [Methylomonas]|nr:MULTISPECIES: hypothetical protein [Methylomonas]WNB75553.1 hypothetical protein RI210_20085 [Methylomonas koyamae]
MPLPVSQLSVAGLYNQAVVGPLLFGLLVPSQLPADLADDVGGCAQTAVG